LIGGSEVDRYILIEGSIGTDEKLGVFKAEVNEKIKKGYVPVGSPVIAGEWIIQALLGKDYINYFPHPNPLG